MASDPKVFHDGDHWTMFYFGLGANGHANIMAAFSTDLLNWTASPQPLYLAGGNPSGLDSTYAHKISLVYNSQNDTYYMYYCAVGNQGRGIGLLTSRPLPEPGTLAMLATGSAVCWFTVCKTNRGNLRFIEQACACMLAAFLPTMTYSADTAATSATASGVTSVAAARQPWAVISQALRAILRAQLLRHQREKDLNPSTLVEQCRHAGDMDHPP